MRLIGTLVYCLLLIVVAYGLSSMAEDSITRAAEVRNEALN